MRQGAVACGKLEEAGKAEGPPETPEREITHLLGPKFPPKMAVLVTS